MLLNMVVLVYSRHFEDECITWHIIPSSVSCKHLHGGDSDWEVVDDTLQVRPFAVVKPRKPGEETSAAVQTRDISSLDAVWKPLKDRIRLRFKTIQFDWAKVPKSLTLDNISVLSNQVALSKVHGNGDFWK